MATISSNAANGRWNSGSTWSTGSVPTLNDDVTIVSGRPVIEPSDSSEMKFKTLTLRDQLTFDNDIQTAAGGSIVIAAGGSIVRKQAAYPVQRRFYSASGAWSFLMNYQYPDTRRVDVGGVRLERNYMTLSCLVNGGNYPYAGSLYFGDQAAGEYWMSEIGKPSCGKRVIDAANQGVGRNYSKPSHGVVRHISVKLKFPKEAGDSVPYSYDYGETLRRWAQSPYPVLLAGRYNVFKGHIESINYQDVKGNYHSCQVSLVEALDG